MARQPDDPTDLTKPSWFATLKRTFREFKEDDLTDWAAALTYYAVLSMFPALIALISIASLVVPAQDFVRVLTDLIGQLGPASAVDTFRGPIEGLARSTKAGFGLVIGLAVALWSASGYIGAFMRASNAIYEKPEGRPFYKLRPLQLLVTLVLVLMTAIVLLALIVSGPVAETVGSAVGLGDAAVTAFQWGKWPVLLVVIMLMLAILYYTAPNAKLKGFKWISPGSVFAVVLWIIASALFAFYVANFGSYDKTYGTLAGVIVFLVWMWITNIAVLLGAELNAEVERSREIEAGVPGAEEDIQLPLRDEPKRKEKARG
jgi:membrane protein